MDLSIIIVNFKTIPLLKRQLHALSLFNIKLNYEIIVVENGTNENIKPILNEYKNINLLVISKNNLGFGGGVNLGSKYAKGKYLLLLNADIVPHENSMENMYNFIKNHENIGILAPKLVYPDGSTQNSCYRFYNFLTPLFRRTFLGKTKRGKFEVDKVIMNDFSHDKIIEIDWALGACFMVKKEFFDKVNGIEDRYHLYYEDMDFCRKTWIYGKKVVYFPEAIMTHNHDRATARHKNIFKALGNPVVITHIISSFKYNYKFFLK